MGDNEGESSSSHVEQQELSPSRQHPRIVREDMFAIMALWMERCPLNGDNPPDQPSIVKPDTPGQFGVDKAGAVFVNKNDRIVAMDCSRKRHKDGVPVHAAARVLIKFPDKVKGCTVYMSRKPCSFCVKLLVQAEVSRIRFLPFQPEASPDRNCDDLQNASRTENLLRICPVGMSVYMPATITKKVQTTLESSIKKANMTVESTCATEFFKSFEEHYWSGNVSQSQGYKWVEYLSKIAAEGKESVLRCSGISGSVINDWTNKIMGQMMKWIAATTVQLVPNFFSLKVTVQEAVQEAVQEPVQDLLARHMSRMSLIASRRTDDPDCLGVGVILMMKDEVISVGLNGFPSKSQFGDFPRSFLTSGANQASGEVRASGANQTPGEVRASGANQAPGEVPASGANQAPGEVPASGANQAPGEVPASGANQASNENPYLLHAEQNALLLRNTRNIDHKSTTAYISKVPCEICLVLLAEAGVKNLVLPRRPSGDAQQLLSQFSDVKTYYFAHADEEAAKKNLFK